MNITGKFLEALKFAAGKHRDQRRKDVLAIPYINHPIEVAYLLWHVGGVRETEILLAGLLHDTIEDTKTTPSEIEAAFGEKVLGYVLEVTDDKRLSKKERKRLQIVQAPNKSDGAKQIKLADKSANIQDIITSPPAGWDIARRNDYLNWAESVVDGVRGVNPDLEAHFDKLLKKGRAFLEADALNL
jgi:guanosine-3',5'-bis(diphosphate) 3'-pyrophosphohydrolase